jgi:hypothetical protein
MHLPAVMHPQVPSVRQQRGFPLHPGQYIWFGQLRGLVPELDPAPASPPELLAAPLELAPPPLHAPALHVPPTVVQSWHDPAPVPHAMSIFPS